MFLFRRVLTCSLKRYFHNDHHSIKLDGKPLGSIFFHPKTQYYMKKLILQDDDHVFQLKGTGKRLKTPSYEFMTDEELEEAREKAKNNADFIMQIPPIIDKSEDKVEILSNDSSLDGHEAHHCKVVFTDISYNLKHYERTIVVREANGLLRTANKNERRRMNQIYFPAKGRSMKTPKMFEREYLHEILLRKDYEFILDRACIQFEPDDEEFHMVLTTTFEHVNEQDDFKELRLTRHFPSLAFYLAAQKKMNKMLRFFIDNGKHMESAFLICLYRTIHECGNTNVKDSEEEPQDLSVADAFQIVENYVADPRNGAEDLRNAVEKMKNCETYEIHRPEPAQ